MLIHITPEPITTDDLVTAAALLMTWRNQHRQWFLNSDKVSLLETVRFLKTTPKNIYMIVEQDRPKGTVGFLVENGRLLLDHVICGERGSSDMMLTHARDVMRLAYQNLILDDKKMYSQIIEGNTAAFVFNSMLGFRFVKRFTEIDKHGTEKQMIEMVCDLEKKFGDIND